MPHFTPLTLWMIYAGAGVAFALACFLVVAVFRWLLVGHRIALLSQEIAASQQKQVSRVTCDCCRRHGKITWYLYDDKEARVCRSCEKRLRTFLNTQKNGSLSPLQDD